MNDPEQILFATVQFPKTPTAAPCAPHVSTKRDGKPCRVARFLYYGFMATDLICRLGVRQWPFLSSHSFLLIDISIYSSAWCNKLCVYHGVRRTSKCPKTLFCHCGSPYFVRQFDCVLGLLLFLSFFNTLLLILQNESKASMKFRSALDAIIELKLGSITRKISPLMCHGYDICQRRKLCACVESLILMIGVTIYHLLCPIPISPA